MLKNIILAVVSAFTSLITFLFGRVSWSRPVWLGIVCTKSAAKPKTLFYAGTGFFLSVFAIIYCYHWYTTRPQPERITANITVPAITPVEKVLVPDVLAINFGVKSGSQLLERSVAPLDLIGKEVKKGITITPAVAGVWMWQGDSQLTFTPAVDWPAATHYSVTFDEAAFAKGAKMGAWSYDFSTRPFTAKIEGFKLYVDPVNPLVRQAVATVNFNYPVDPDSLSSRVAVTWQASKSNAGWVSPEPLKYTITYDENKRIAYLRTGNIELPRAEQFLSLKLGKGINPLNGASGLEYPLSEKILIPDASSYFRVLAFDSAIVRNKKDRPEQILTVETSLGMQQDELNKSLHVYLLPQDYPATANEAAKLNYEWNALPEITPQILALSKELKLTTIPADRDYATLHSYQYDAATPAYLYVTTDSDMHGLGNYAAIKSYASILKVPEYPKEISFMHKGALLALGTEEKISVLVRGLPAVKFKIARVLPDDVSHLITQTGGDFNNPYFTNYNFSQDNISDIFTEVQQFDASDAAKQQYTALDLSKYLGSKSNQAGSLGLFLLQANGWDAVNKTVLSPETKHLILVTDLGLIVKDNQDGTHDVFVESISKGKPVGNIDVAILGKNGVAIFTRKTDAQGRASFPSLKSFSDEHEPTVFVARQQNDTSFIPYDRFDRKLNFTRFDIGGLYTNDGAQGALTAYVFSDRGIYRPGDEAHIAMIIKQPYVLPQPAGLPLEATITDSRGSIVKTEKVTLNDSGYLTLDYKSNASSPTGKYDVNLFIVKDKYQSSLIGSTTFTVAEFLPDRMRITASLSGSKKGWLSPVGLTDKIGLWNLYGAPSVYHRIAGKLVLAPHAVSFKEYSDYTFVDPLLNPKAPPKVFTDTLADTKTNDKGEAELDLKLDRFEKATYQLTVYAEGFEAEGGRSVTAQTTALVSPLHYLVGYKADGALGYIKQNAIRNVRFIAITPELQQQNLADLKLQIFKLSPVISLVKNVDGTYEYKSVVQTTLVSSKAFTIADTGTDVALPSEEIGEYSAAIVDQSDTSLAQLKFSVVGASAAALPKNAELSVRLNKSEFAPNEDIEMEISSPYSGAGLITIERDKVYASQWFTASATNSVQKIHIPSDFKGNGYVNIAFVRDLNSPEIFMSPLSYSVAPFSVSHSNQDIKIDLTTPVLARPGEPFTMHYKTDKPGKIIVFAVDEGILQVSRYETPDPLRFFFQKHALEVNTSQIVDQILPKFIAERELSTVGGDDGAAALNMNLNPFKRKTDAPVVYWSGILDSDNSDHQLTYRIPDYFNGSLRVMAVAVAADAVGAAAKTSEVRGPFVISPNVPTFVAPGDEFVMTASIANNVEGSGANAEVTVQLTASSQLKIVDPSAVKIVVPEGQERSVHFKVKATQLLGSAELKLTSKLGDKTTSLASSLSVRPPVAYATSVASGFTSDANMSLQLNRKLYPEYRTVEATASSSPLILITGLQRYLDEYPHGCTEQLVSKALPWLVMANQPWFTDDADMLSDKVQTTIQMLGQRQTSSGGFSYWPEISINSNDEFASLYAMNFLTEAKARGFSVQTTVYANGLEYLRDVAVAKVSTLDAARNTAYAIYLLSRNEIVTTNYLTNLQLTLDENKDIDWKNDITSAYIAATYQMLKSNNEADKLINYYQPQKSRRPSSYDFYNNNIADAEYLYLVAKHFPSRLPNVDAELRQTLVASLNDDNISTVLSGYTALALAAYSEASPAPANAQLSINEVFKDGKVNLLASSSTVYQKVSVDIDATKLNFNNPAKNSYFYQLVQAGFDLDLPKKAISSGLDITREYTNIDNAAISNIKLGDEIVVHIRIRATDNQSHANIAIVDLLPGGFEAVRSSVVAGSMDYADVREDRVNYFGTIGPTSIEISYRIKATNAGVYVVPPVAAMSMYNPMVKAVGVVGEVIVGG